MVGTMYRLDELLVLVGVAWRRLGQFVDGAEGGCVRDFAADDAAEVGRRHTTERGRVCRCRGASGRHDGVHGFFAPARCRMHEHMGTCILDAPNATPNSRILRTSSSLVVQETFATAAVGSGWNRNQAPDPL